MGGPKTFAAIMLILAVVVFLILIYYFIKATGNSDFMLDGLKMLSQRNTSIPG